MFGETGLKIYKPGKEGEKKRIQDWGFHCSWPPRWPKLTPVIEAFTQYMLSEREEIYQAEFQKKVAEALRMLDVPEPENLSIERLAEESRKHVFFIRNNGTIWLPQRDLWIGQSTQRWRSSI